MIYYGQMATKEKETAQEKRFSQELTEQLVNLATAGFGLVAALAWNQAIQDFVTKFLEPHIPGSGLISKFVYAILITLIAVLVTYQLSHLASRFQRKKD